MRKRIALITTWFPPKSGVAVNRMRSFANYLSADFDVDVYTTDGETQELKEGVKVFRCSSTSYMDRFADKQSDGKVLHVCKVLFRMLLGKIVRDPMKHWKGEISRVLSENQLDKPYDCVISSYSPIEVHEVAYQFKQSFPEVKWVADMRDEMSMNPNLSDSIRASYRNAEQRYARLADAIITVSLPILKDFERLMPGVKHVEEIRNGFDHELNIKEHDSAEFTLGYFGTFYGKIKPDYLFQALLELFEAEQLSFRIKLVGVHANFHIPSALTRFVEVLPPLSYPDAIALMAQSTCNILIHPIGERKGVYTGKLFDYISVKRPIIACIDPDDVASELIHRYDAGYVAAFDNIKDIKSVLQTAFSDWKNKHARYNSPHDVQELHRKVQVDKLKHLILNLTA